MPSRLLGAGMLSAVVLAVLASAAVAAQGGGAPGAPPPAVPVLSRVPSPQPIPEGVVTPVTPRAQGARNAAPPAPGETAPPGTTTTEIAVPPPPPPPPPPVIPQGKGMWVWKPEKADGGNVAVMIARAKSAGLTHIVMRTGSTWDGPQN